MLQDSLAIDLKLRSNNYKEVNFVDSNQMNYTLTEGLSTGCPFWGRVKEAVNKDHERKEEIADPETTTPDGCCCTSLCNTSREAGNFAYDWCNTNDGCGEYGLFSGYWDKCKYLDSAKPYYIAMEWKYKQSQMWANILSDNSIGPFQEPTAFMQQSMQTSFENEWDVMPAGRTKLIHTVGPVCPFKVNIKDSPFTGILQNGEAHGLIRFSAANGNSLDVGFRPGAGVKFFRSGKSSANFVANPSVNLVPNHNFFAVPLSNHQPGLPNGVPISFVPPGTLSLLLKLCQGQSCTSKVGLSDLCTYDQEGKKVDEVVFPFKVSLVPTGELNFRENYSGVSQFLKEFTDLPVGTTLYTFKGHQSPDDIDGLVLANVVTTDKCVTSLYGDTKLAFKHQYIHEDKELRPEWADGYDKDCGSHICELVTNKKACPEAGTGWKLVRHVPPGTMWHKATDQLRGTDKYGDPNGHSEFSVKFIHEIFHEFLFSTGDCSKWLIAKKKEVIGDDGNLFYANAERQILKSSKSNIPYKAKWYRRRGAREDPWISIIDHFDAISTQNIVYGEANFGHAHANILSSHDGANVFIR